MGRQEPFRMFTERRAKNARMVLGGELDMAVVADFEEKVREVARDIRPHELVIDLRGLEYIDSAGLGAMLRAGKIARAEGFRLVIVRGSHDVQRAFEMSGLAQSLEIVDWPPNNG